jgi:hypothetical protein
MQSISSLLSFILPRSTRTGIITGVSAFLFSIIAFSHRTMVCKKSIYMAHKIKNFYDRMLIKRMAAIIFLLMLKNELLLKAAFNTFDVI